jgi:hypothetical protein
MQALVLVLFLCENLHMLKLSVLLLLSISISQASDSKPKYGPNATPLSDNTNHEYFVKNAAPDYWAISSFYLPQPTDRSCSATSFTMVLNAFRSKRSLTSADEILTVQSFIEKYTDDRYNKAMGGGSSILPTFSHGEVANTRLVEVLKTSMNKLNLTTPTTVIENHVIDQKDLPKSRKEFHDMLVKNEKSADDFIVLSFVQGILTGDPEGMLAHVAPVGAYDEKKHLVLVMDPDRKWYGPYWSPEDKVFDSIADSRSDADHPSWIYVKIK